jgi:hypothetical protein
VEEVILSQDKSETIHLSYRVKNPNPFRVTASTCLRLYTDACGCSIDEDSSSSDYSLAPGASVTETVPLSLTDEKNWDRANRFKVYVGPFGWGDIPEGIHTPVVEEEEHSHSDEDPEPEPASEDENPGN